MTTMDAVVFHQHGDVDVLVSETLEVAEPGPGQVRVAIRAVAVNHLDLWVRRGGPAFRLDLPHRLGCDMAGVVDACGVGVSDLAVGQKVVVNPGVSCGHCQECLHGRDNLCRHYHILGETTQGGYAQFLCVPRANIAAFPEPLSFVEAAASLLTFLTAWQMLVVKARVAPGQTVLVQGAGSGVGVAATQIARLFGAEVIATASTAEKLAKARALGASATINYVDQDFVDEVKKLTGKRGVDVVVDHVGGETFSRSILATRKGGRIVTCGATSGFEPQIDLRHVYFRQIEILGSTMGSKGDLLDILPHLSAGRLRPVVDRVLPLHQAAEAHRLLEERKVFGKIVLEPARPQ